MRYAALALFFTLGTLAVAESAHAQWGEVWARPFRDMHRTKVWPAPFHFADRCAVRLTFGGMINRGWQLDSTISNYYFDPGTQRLNRAGVPMSVHPQGRAGTTASRSASGSRTSREKSQVGRVS